MNLYCLIFFNYWFLLIISVCLKLLTWQLSHFIGASSAPLRSLVWRTMLAQHSRQTLAHQQRAWLKAHFHIFFPRVWALFKKSQEILHICQISLILFSKIPLSCQNASPEPLVRQSKSRHVARTVNKPGPYRLLVWTDWFITARRSTLIDKTFYDLNL